MVITRSHINEQISKGGNKMVDVRKRPGYKKPLKYVKDQKTKSGFDAFGVEKRKLQKQTKEKKKIDRYSKDPMLTQKVTKKKPTPDILKGKPKKVDKTIQTKKDIEQRHGGKKDPLKKIKGTRKTQHMTFGGQKVKVPGRKYAKGGDVVMQKVRKYKEGGTVVHDQSTIKNV